MMSKRLIARAGRRQNLLLLGEAIEDSWEAGNVEATPDNRPDRVAGVGAPQKGTKDIDDPDQNEADTNIPDEDESNVKAC